MWSLGGSRAECVWSWFQILMILEFRNVLFNSLCNYSAIKSLWWAMSLEKSDWFAHQHIWQPFHCDKRSSAGWQMHWSLLVWTCFCRAQGQQEAGSQVESEIKSTRLQITLPRGRIMHLFWKLLVQRKQDRTVNVHNATKIFLFAALVN